MSGDECCHHQRNQQKSLTLTQKYQNYSYYSRKDVMKGGEFCVNLRGLEHYSEHGYKGSLSGDSTGGWRRPGSPQPLPKLSSQSLPLSHSTSKCVPSSTVSIHTQSTIGQTETAPNAAAMTAIFEDTQSKSTNTGRYLRGGVHINDETHWVTIPYAFNRGIVHRGDLPHLSAPIEHIRSKDSNSNSIPSCQPEIDNGTSLVTSPPQSRVIVGFNVFGHDVGARIAKAPEHSKQFRRRVRWYRAAMNACVLDGEESLYKTSTSATTPLSTEMFENAVRGNASIPKKIEDDKVGRNTSNGVIDLSQIRKNKGLTKLLVLAKREIVKEALRRNQEQLSRNIWQRLLRHHRKNAINSEPSVAKTNSQNKSLLSDYGTCSQRTSLTAMDQVDQTTQVSTCKESLLRVADIVEEFGRPNDGSDGEETWPNSIDVHVHVHHMLKDDKKTPQGKSKRQWNPTGRVFHDIDGIAGVPGAWYSMVVGTRSESSSDSGGGESANGILIPLSTPLDVQNHGKDI